MKLNSKEIENLLRNQAEMDKNHVLRLDPRKNQQNSCKISPKLKNQTEN